MTASKAAAVRDEAVAPDKHIEFIHNGETYRALPQSEWLVETLVYMEDGQYTKAIRQLMPAEDFANYIATKPKVDDLGPLMESLTSAMGIQGN